MYAGALPVRAYAPPWSVTEDDRRQTTESKTILAPYTMCRQAINNLHQ